MLAGSVYWKADREKRKELDGVMDERKKMAKRQKWLAELEARHEEDQAYRRKMERMARGEPEAKSVLESCEQRSILPRSNLGILESVQDLIRGR